MTDKLDRVRKAMKRRPDATRFDLTRETVEALLSEIDRLTEQRDNMVAAHALAQIREQNARAALAAAPQPVPDEFENCTGYPVEDGLGEAADDPALAVRAQRLHDAMLQDILETPIEEIEAEVQARADHVTERPKREHVARDVLTRGVDRDALVEVIREARRKWQASWVPLSAGAGFDSHIADALLARGLRLPGGGETMQREDVERVKATVMTRQDEDGDLWVLACDYAELLDRAERAEAENRRLTADLNGLNAWVPIWQNDGKIWRERAECAEAERDAAFAAGQAEMRARAIAETTATKAEDATRERIRALPIKARPE